MATDESVNKGSPEVSLADEEGVKDVLVRTVLGLWEIVNDLTRLRPSRRERYRVTIFGSARGPPGPSAYHQVHRIAAALAEAGCGVVPAPRPVLDLAADTE